MKVQMPPQEQSRQPGIEREMDPKPEVIRANYRGSGKLENRVAIITGGDSGIGRSAAVHMAREGADIVVMYLDEHEDAEDTQGMIEAEGRRALLIPGDVGQEEFCQSAVARAVDEFGRLDILVNNAVEEYLEDSIEAVQADQLENSFRTNVFGYFYMTKAAVPHMKPGSSIINTTSINAYKGNPKLLSYSATKGAIVALTRSLATGLLERGIRVNGVAPGPIWTPLIPATSDAKGVGEFGSQAPMERAGQPSEVGPCYVFLASEDSSYMTGQVLHPNGGTVVNG